MSAMQRVWLQLKRQQLAQVQELLDAKALTAEDLLELVEFAESMPRLAKEHDGHRAAMKRHSQLKGTHDKRAQVLAMFKTWPTNNRAACAKAAASSTIGVSQKTARNYLIGTTNDPAKPPR